jgi:hypothetical protein
MVVTEHGRWLVPDPATGEARVGQRRSTATPSTSSPPSGPRPSDSSGRCTGPSSRSRPASPGRSASGPATAAAEAAGFAAVELVLAAVGATWAPGSPVAGRGRRFWCTTSARRSRRPLLRVGDDLPEVLATAAILDWPGDAEHRDRDRELSIACCRELLDARARRAWVLPVGGGAARAGLVPALEDALGRPVARWPSRSSRWSAASRSGGPGPAARGDGPAGRGPHDATGLHHPGRIGPAAALAGTAGGTV